MNFLASNNIKEGEWSWLWWAWKIRWWIAGFSALLLVVFIIVIIVLKGKP